MMFSSVRSIEIGVITHWSGALGNIPPGWFLCDGSNNTPDLRDRFVTSVGPTFAVDETGGSITHAHTFTSNGHTHGNPGGFGMSTIGPFSGSTDEKTLTGTTIAAANIPPFFALAYIQFNG